MRAAPKSARAPRPAHPESFGPRSRARPASWWFAALAVVGAGCAGPQSALAPAGRDAERIAALFGWMAAGAVIVWLATIAIALWAARVRPEKWSARRSRLLIVGGGAVVPAVVLGGLLAYGLSMLPDMLAPAPEGSLRISVAGEQWWWRVRYAGPGGEVIELANEIRLPVGEPVDIRLESSNVIHSFWVPSLGGKRDMIPGRVTNLVLHPTRVGVYRGVCAEYCGTGHAQMHFLVEVMERPAFDRWLRAQAAPAREPSTPLAARGREQFLANGCGACHGVRGTPANGVVGPDLTHVGGRMSLGAGILPNDVAAFRQWVEAADREKPGVHMPRFDMLSDGDLRALAAYLESLE